MGFLASTARVAEEEAVAGEALLEMGVLVVVDERVKELRAVSIRALNTLSSSAAREFEQVAFAICRR